MNFKTRRQGKAEFPTKTLEPVNWTGLTEQQLLDTYAAVVGEVFRRKIPIERLQAVVSAARSTTGAAK